MILLLLTKFKPTRYLGQVLFFLFFSLRRETKAKVKIKQNKK